jgi:hypothetical protein
MTRTPFRIWLMLCAAFLSPFVAAGLGWMGQL